MTYPKPCEQRIARFYFLPPFEKRHFLLRYRDEVCYYYSKYPVTKEESLP